MLMSVDEWICFSYHVCVVCICIVSPTITNPVTSTATSTITSTTSAVVNAPVPLFPSVSADIHDFCDDGCSTG